ncbi:MAG: DUF718 domain-containing protein [Rhodobacter sp.]|nr:DUF718 domain-containing protein [Rhodobacter sp.]
MTAFNVVRFKVRPGKDHAFLSAHGPGKVNWPSLQQGTIIRIGAGDYCLIGEWLDEQALKAALPSMLATLDTFRDVLLPTTSGVTEAMSGQAVLAIA